MHQKLNHAIRKLAKRALLAGGITGELIVEYVWADSQYCTKHPLRVLNYARALNKASSTEECNDDISIPSGMTGLPAAGERSRQLLLDNERSKGCAASTITEGSGEARRKRRALLISHEMSLTGAPLMLLNTAKALRRAGFDVSVWSPLNGEAAPLFEDEGFPVNIVTVADLSKTLVRKSLSACDLVICNTILCDEYADHLDGKLPLLWYLHEADTIGSFVDGNMRRELTLKRSDSLVTVSEYARDRVKAFNRSPVHVLRNAIPDSGHLSHRETSVGKTRLNFMTMGTIIPTKGFDLLCKAYLAMPDSYRRRSKLQIVGNYIEGFDPYAEKMKSIIDRDEGIEYLGFVGTEKEKAAVFDQADVFVLPSRGDACPLVVLEAAMFSKPLIVSDHVGSKYLVDSQNGIVFESENIEALRDALMEMIDKRDSLDEMGRRSRENYEREATIEAYEHQLIQLVETKIRAFENTKNT